MLFALSGLLHCLFIVLIDLHGLLDVILIHLNEVILACPFSGLAAGYGKDGGLILVNDVLLPDDDFIAIGRHDSDIFGQIGRSEVLSVGTEEPGKLLLILLSEEIDILKLYFKSAEVKL